MAERIKNDQSGSAEPQASASDDGDVVWREDEADGPGTDPALESLLARITGRLNAAPGQEKEGSTEDADDATGSGELAAAAAESPQTGTADQEEAPPKQPAEPQAETGVQPPAEDAPQQDPEGPLKAKDDIPGENQAADDERSPETAAEAPTEPPEARADDGSAEAAGQAAATDAAVPGDQTATRSPNGETAADGADGLPSDPSIAAWPEQWGPPSPSNVLKVLGDLLAQVDQRPEDLPDGAAPGRMPPGPLRQPADEAGEAENTPAGAATARPRGPQAAEVASGTPPGSGDTPTDSSAPAPAKADGRGAASQPSGPANLAQRLLAPLAQLGVIGAAAGQGGGRPRAETERPPDPTDDPPGAKAAPSPRTSRPAARATGGGVPAAPAVLKAVPRGPRPHRAVVPVHKLAKPVRAHRQEFSPWFLEQPEFQRAFGINILEKQRALAGSGTAETEAEKPRTRRPLLVAGALVAAIVVGFAAYTTQFDGWPQLVGRDAGPSDNPEALQPPAPEPDPVVAEARDLAPAEAGSEAGFAAGEPAPAPNDTFRPIAPSGETKPTVKIEKTVVRPFAGGPSTNVDRTNLDLAAREAAALVVAYRIDEADRLVGDILARDPRHFGALMNSGRIALLRDDFLAAEARFSEAAAVNQSSASARLGLAEALLGQRRGADAAALLDAIVAAAPDEPAAYDLRARANAQTGELEAMMLDCNELAKRIGASYVGDWCRGLAFKDAGDLPAATAALIAAIAGGGEDFVRHRQLYLKYRGHYVGEVDGKAGPETRQAVEACVADPLC